MQRVERHIILNSKELDSLCWLSKNLCNYCNFILRQVYINKHDDIQDYVDLIKTFTAKDGKICYTISEYDLSKRLSELNQVDYRNLPSQTSQQVIKLLYKNWKSFFKSIKEWSKDKSKFKGKPKLPKYKKKDGKNIVVFTNQNVRLKDSFIRFPSKTQLKPIKTKVINFKQVRIIPQATCYVMEVVYEKKINQVGINENNYLAIDLGVNNLATCSNNIGEKPFIVNGRIVKSINQYFNKKKAKLQSALETTNKRKTSKKINRLIHKRNCKVDDYLHKTSRFIVDYCVEHEIGNIVIGYNKSWKDSINIGRVNNQKFVQIPYEKLISQIEYKAEEVGIKTTRQEESYTSKCDSLACEEIRKHGIYSGRRIKRGLFRSSIGILINADLNGSLNILRKVIGDSFVKEIANRGTGVVPHIISLC